MFLHLSVSHSVHRGEYTPLGRHPPGRYPSPGRHPPPEDGHCSGRTIRILLECTLVNFLVLSIYDCFYYSMVALISEHRDVATVCFDKIATLTQINADDFVHFCYFLVARLPKQDG